MSFDPGPLATVPAEPAGDRWTLVSGKDPRHPRELVRASLSDPDRSARRTPGECDRDLGTTGYAQQLGVGVR
jgi:hypothetical protein